MDGISGVEARISEIQGRIASLHASSRPSSNGSALAFAGALAAARASSPSLGGVAPMPALTMEDRLTAGRLQGTATSPASLTADGVPASLAAYGNGRIPVTALSSTGRGDHRLWAPAAGAFDRLSAAAARDGVTIGVTDSYRSYDAQVDLAARKGLYSQGGLAAAPGTSDHGWGRALDLDLDAGARAWMRANAGDFGFVGDTPREPWHWVYTAEG